MAMGHAHAQEESASSARIPVLPQTTVNSATDDGRQSGAGSASSGSVFEVRGQETFIGQGSVAWNAHIRENEMRAAVQEARARNQLYHDIAARSGPSPRYRSAEEFLKANPPAMPRTPPQERDRSEPEAREATSAPDFEDPATPTYEDLAPPREEDSGGMSDEPDADLPAFDTPKRGKRFNPLRFLRGGRKANPGQEVGNEFEENPYVGADVTYESLPDPVADPASAPAPVPARESGPAPEPMPASAPEPSAAPDAPDAAGAADAADAPPADERDLFREEAIREATAGPAPEFELESPSPERSQRKGGGGLFSFLAGDRSGPPKRSREVAMPPPPERMRYGAAGGPIFKPVDYARVTRDVEVTIGGQTVLIKEGTEVKVHAREGGSARIELFDLREATIAEGVLAPVR